MRVPPKPAITSPTAPDLEQVRAWLWEKILALRVLDVIAAVITLIARMRDLNLELAMKIAHLKRRRPPSETLVRLERQLMLPCFDAPPKKKRGPRSTDRSNHPGRNEMPAHLRRVESKNPVPDNKRICPKCGGEMKSVCFSVGCEYLDVIPAEFVVVRRMDETVACPQDDAIVRAEAPPRIVDGGKLGDALLVEAVCDKFIEHLPTERQATSFKRAGVEIAPQTLGRGMTRAIDLLQPIAEAIADRTREPGILGTDATSIPILDPEVANGIRTGAIWCWTNARWVSFFYSASGDSKSVREFLRGDIARTVQCDGTSVTSFIEREGGKRPGCWSHGRRGFVEAARAGDLIALETVRRIAPIFAVERTSMLSGDTAEDRRKRRDEYTRPVLDDLHAWVEDNLGAIAPKTPLGRAFGYLQRQWKRLTLFLDDGNIEATNNRRERELRPYVLGRKNWLFTWEDDGGERVANILSIIATAISHEVNPRAYLHLVVRRILDGWPQAKLRELLPDRMLVAHPELFIGEIDDLPILTAPAPAIL
jgi:transposase